MITPAAASTAQNFQSLSDRHPTGSFILEVYQMRINQENFVTQSFSHLNKYTGNSLI
jgi:hypothetical protein